MEEIRNVLGDLGHSERGLGVWLGGSSSAAKPVFPVASRSFGELSVGYTARVEEGLDWWALRGVQS